jgi:glutamate formiminotransferase/formiminotetrahydrofolate cyclodeaminase
MTGLTRGDAMSQIVECVPNFSEGRRPEVLEEIVAALRSVPGVLLLDREMDADHNRAVVTIAGPPQDVLEAAYRAVAKAAERIDLRVHTGEHPRMGATDVVPFVPIRGVSMDDCVALARALGDRVGRELGIPVFLYEAAATRPDRANLADVRRGEFEGLAKEIGANPDRAPDFGPAAIHATAGATAIGARMPLIAYNVNLGARDVAVAKKVAKAVRFAGGGLRHVKAMGFELRDRGLAQVSMNLVNHKETPIHRAFEMVRREAERYGVPVVGSEIVGLVPEDAIVESADFFLRLESFSPGQILENRLRAAVEAAAAPDAAFLDRLASSAPTPGGGSVAALCGALGAALVSMVSRLTLGSKKYVEVHEPIKEILQRSESMRSKLANLIDRDAEAFEKVLRAYKMPKGSDGEEKARGAAIERGLVEAIAVPLETMELAEGVLELASRVAAVGNVKAISDAGVAAYMAEAAVRSAALNVRINAAALADESERRRSLTRAERSLEAVRTKIAAVEAAVLKKI